jgi:hypothetical protein
LITPVTVSEYEAILFKSPPNDFGGHFPMAVSVELVNRLSATILASDPPGSEIPNEGVSNPYEPLVSMV